MSIEIREIVSKREKKEFVTFGNKLYESDPNFCPSLLQDELNALNPLKNPAHEVCESVYYMAYRDGNPVGRIAGIINHEANKAWQNRRVRFGWFDTIDNEEVATALLSSVEKWGRAKGMTELNGPLGFTDFDHQGLVVEGFDNESPMACLYNYPYYEKHIEAFGLKKEMDWIEYQICPPKEVPERMARVGHIIREKYDLSIVKVKNATELKKRYGYTYFDVIDLAYRPLYNFQPLTQKQKEYYSDVYFPLMNFDFVTFVVNKQDEIVGVGVGMPNLTKALRKCNGALFPLGWYYLLKALRSKKFEAFDLLLIAVRPDYQNKGVNSLFFIDQIPYFNKYGIKRVESTGILEVNNKSLANYEYFEKRQHRRRRAYVKAI